MGPDAGEHRTKVQKQGRDRKGQRAEDWAVLKHLVPQGRSNYHSKGTGYSWKTTGSRDEESFGEQ